MNFEHNEQENTIGKDEAMQKCMKYLNSELQ